jgi:hypothetical protein
MVDDMPTPPPTPPPPPADNSPAPAPISGAPQYHPLALECFDLMDGDFTYVLCPYVNITQSQGTFSYSLGVWTQWDETVVATAAEGEPTPVKMLYESGTACADGTLRAASVEMLCGDASALTSVQEPSTCNYAFVFETPLACDMSDGARGAVPSVGEEIFGAAVDATNDAGAPCTELAQCNARIVALARELEETKAIAAEGQRVLQAVLGGLVAPVGERQSQLDAVLAATAAAAAASGGGSAEAGCAAGDAACAGGAPKGGALGALLGALRAPFARGD